MSQVTASLAELLPAPKNILPTARDEGSSRLARPSPFVRPPQRRKSGVSNVIPLTVGEDGRPDYNAVLRIGEDANKIVHDSYDSIVEKSYDEEELAKPSEKEADEVTQRTREALEKIVDRKIASAKPKNFRGAGERRISSYIRYTPSNTSKLHNSGAKQRIVKMMEAPVDPMEPSRFKRKKAPANPPSPPVPVLHSPNRKVSKEELEDWKIPPCVSNWKNNHGYTIPLDKRLAADGRGLQDNRINDRFSTLAESLYVAERTARAEVEARAKVLRAKSLKEKEAQEKKLRELASKAREERAGIRPRSPSPGANLNAGIGSINSDRSPAEPASYASPERSATFDRHGSTRDSLLTREEETAVRRRDMIREERRRERERELRRREIHDEGENNRPTLRRSKLTRDRDRDVSERIALGQSVGAGGARGEVMYDQRLFNQTESGLSAGFGPDDGYNIYDKPLFSGRVEKFQYRGRVDATENGRTSEFRADYRFKGVDDTDASKNRGPRNRLVEFERESKSSDYGKTRSEVDRDDADADPFGLNKFLTAAKKGRSERIDDALGKRRHGLMHAGGSSARQLEDEYRERGWNSKRGRLQFRSAGTSLH